MNTLGMSSMDLHLKDKVVLITGSSRGIGLATAKAFAAEGGRIVLSARSPSALAEAEACLHGSGATVAARVADLIQPDQAAELVRTAVTAFRAALCADRSPALLVQVSRAYPNSLLRSTAVRAHIASGKRTMNPSRLGIRTLGRVCAFIVSFSPINLFCAKR